MHNELYSGVWKSEIMEARAKVLPVNIIEGFLKIKFESNKAFLSFGSSHEVNYFLQNNRVVRSAPTWQETALKGTNNIVKNRSETVNEDFGDDFVSNVTKADWSKVFIGFWLVNFGDKRNESVSYGWVEGTGLEGCVNKAENVFTNNVPVLFEENAMEPIWARRFVGFHGVESC
jgi:hypothetical protein